MSESPIVISKLPPNQEAPLAAPIRLDRTKLQLEESQSPTKIPNKSTKKDISNQASTPPIPIINPGQLEQVNCCEFDSEESPITSSPGRISRISRFVFAAQRKLLTEASEFYKSPVGYTKQGFVDAYQLTGNLARQITDLTSLKLINACKAAYQSAVVWFKSIFATSSSDQGETEAKAPPVETNKYYSPVSLLRKIGFLAPLK